MGIVSEILPTFSKKPLFGYPVIVLSGIIIGFMGWMVWSHHMFTVGLGPGGELGLRYHDDGYRGTYGGEDIQLDRNDVGRVDRLQDAHCCSRWGLSRCSSLAV